MQHKYLPIMTDTIIDGDKLMLKLIRCFYRGSHKFNLEHTDANIMIWDWQQEFLNSTLKSTLLQKYPMSKQFVQMFLKKIIDHLERENQEVHDDFYSYLCDSMNNTGANDFSYKHYLINDESEIITIKETNKMVVNGTTGMRTWEAALMLADWVLCHREKFTNKTILELGSGVGFTAITIAKICKPKSIYLTDCHPDVMKAISDNVKINFPRFKVTETQDKTLFIDNGKIIGAMLLNWNSIQELPEDIVPDVVIGADIVYDPSILQPLCDVLEGLFKINKYLEVYIASVIRNEETFESFLKHLGNMNFSYSKLEMTENKFIDWDSSINKCLLKIENK